jgi:ribonuclease HII
MMKPTPTFDIENEYPGMIVAGVDEAGRGPLCGPVIAAAVIFTNARQYLFSQHGIVINDSKQMTQAQREAAYEWITQNTIWTTGQCSPVEIDEINILQASLLAMTRAVNTLPRRQDFVLVDGNKMPAGMTGRAIVKGDTKSISIAAASIVAKVTRDRIMRELARKYPQYGWDKNAGYPTAAHLAAINAHGINEYYRKTFAPIKNLTF